MSTTLSETIEMTITTIENPKVGPELARSWLLVNGAQPARFDVAANSAADVVVLDVEDSVAPADKAAARQNVIEWLSSRNERHELNHGWVRINGFGTAWWEEDLRALREAPGLEGVMLAMTESPEHVTRTAEMLRGTRIVALVETARGVQNLQDIATARSTYRLAFGIGDYRRDTGFGESPMVLAYTRSQFTIASRAANLPGPIDGPAVGALGAKLAEATGVTSEFGMTGKLCLMPEQTATVNEGLSPSLNELSWATDFLQEFEADGGQIRNGSDLPRLARARKVLGLATSFGMSIPEGYDVHFEAPTDTYHC
ncbi:HpcH/HpaI aldolase/citrate lyase family protein [Kocuria carniphila]